MMNKINMKKLILSIIVIIIIIMSVIFGCYYLKDDGSGENTIEVLDSIAGYSYQLEDRDTKLYKETFLKLKDILESEEIDYQKYATYLAELFVIDLYTIDNKISKYDVGALDFIYPEEKEKFQNKLTDTMYKLVEDNTSNTRKQELPIVKEVEIIDMKTTVYQKESTNLEAYQIQIDITYEKDLGYDKKVTLTIVRDESKMYVVNLSAS